MFRALVGGRIWVHVERRAGRKRTNVARLSESGQPDSTRRVELRESAEPPTEESVWLREPPLRDRLAPRVHHLIDVEGHSYRSAAKVLQAKGYNINSGVVWQIYRRHYEMIGKPVPKRLYNNGNERKSA